MTQPRVACHADIPELVRLINAAYRVEDFFIDGDRTHAADIEARMQVPTASFLVLDGDQTLTLVGSVYVTIHGSLGHFGLLAIDPAHQRKGLGRRLVSAVDVFCRQAGCEELQLDYVNLREELPAFYSALGFTATGHTSPLPAEEKLKHPAHLVRMRKSIALPNA